MPEQHAASDFVSLFPSDDIPGIIQSILTSVAPIARIFLCEKENDLTKRFYKVLCRNPEYRRGPIEPRLESSIVVFDGEEPDITGRADIIFTCGRGLETYFPVEAKRLYVTYPSGKMAPLVTDYIKDGMMRYVTGQYASKMVEGAMLGYVCDNTVSAARKALDATVTSNTATLRLAGDGAWQTSALAVTPPIDETRHDLDGRKFTMYHILTKV